jgi:8-oxo-dGTP pyrophosphatase MutT (NUDIX family)
MTSQPTANWPADCTPERLRRALHLPDFDPRPAQQLMMPAVRPLHRPAHLPGEARVGAVLILLYCHQGEPHLPFTRRRDDLPYHAGQLSFPGGRREQGEPLHATALREAQEEIGLDPAGVTILGELTSLYIPASDFLVNAYVAWREAGRPAFSRQAAEVAEILEMPLSYFLRPEVSRREAWQLPGFVEPIDVPFFAINGHKMWGATAIFVSELLARLRQLD